MEGKRGRERETEGEMEKEGDARRGQERRDEPREKGEEKKRKKKWKERVYLDFTNVLNDDFYLHHRILMSRQMNILHHFRGN